MYTETSDSSDDFTKPQVIGYLVLLTFVLVYIFVCAEHQTKLAGDKYGQKTDNPVIHRYH